MCQPFLLEGDDFFLEDAAGFKHYHLVSSELWRLVEYGVTIVFMECTYVHRATHSASVETLKSANIDRGLDHATVA